MKVLIFALGWSLLLTAYTHGQGEFWFYNGMVPTRIGSLDGPLAGPGYFGQMLVGLTPDSLFPVATPEEHSIRGIVNGGIITVEVIPCRSYAYTQLVAWDGNLWGTSLAQVPPDQLGRTDTDPDLF